MKIMLQAMCRYNHWMNEKLYEVCAQMPDELRKEDRGAWFGSMHGILNHLLLADRIWLGRFTGVPFAARSLDEELYRDFQTLRHERAKTDKDLSRWLNALDEEQLLMPFTYSMMTNPQQITQPLWEAALHLFNHQTHHRGQLTTLMEQAGYDSGGTDLISMLRDEKKGQ